MSQTTLEKKRSPKAKFYGPMVDAALLAREGVSPRRAIILYFVGKGLNTNRDLAESLDASTALISSDVDALREMGLMQPAQPHQGPYPRPLKNTASGTRFVTKMLREKN